MLSPLPANLIRPSAPAALTGPVTLANLAQSRANLEGLSKADDLDLSGVTMLDTAGAWAIASFLEAQRKKGRKVSVVGATSAHSLLLETVTGAMPPAHKRRRRPVHHEAGDSLERMGRTISVFAAGFWAWS